MRKINVNEITEQERKSPRGKYHAFYKELSVALGREPRSLDLAKRHPLNLGLMRIPPRATFCPFHSHAAQWELYLVVSGTGAVRHEGGMTEIHAGDTFIFGPGQTHQISNPGKHDLVYYVVADNPVGDSCHDPDRKKWMVGIPQRTIVKGQETD
jgi:mannose-6-phosphate isomerase-like protein (cupin superfamily)